MTLPTFLLLGAPRAGTTALHQWLAHHPDACMSRPKETQFFSLHYERGLDEYRRCFAHHAGEPVVGESTPVYLVLPYVPERIAATLPAVRLVAVLREPVSQAYSTWWKIRSAGAERRSFADAVAAELRDGPPAPDEMPTFWASFLGASEQGHQVDRGGYLLTGHYGDALRRYLDHFDRTQVTVLFTDDLVADPAAFTTRLAEAVGLDPRRAPSPVPPRSNESLGPAQAWMRRRVAGVPSATARRLAVRAVAAFDADGPPPLDPGMERDLRQYFATVNADLAELLGEVPKWAHPRVRSA